MAESPISTDLVLYLDRESLAYQLLLPMCRLPFGASVRSVCSIRHANMCAAVEVWYDHCLNLIALTVSTTWG
jgi:hypothetical protein